MPKPLRSPSPGAVIAVRAPACAEFELGLVLSATERELDIAAVTEEVWQATDRELLLAAGIAGFPAAVFPGVHGWVLREQVDEILGVATPADATAVWTGTGFEAGPPVLGEADPRAVIREEMAERWEPYFEPVVSLRATRTFGELLARRRSEIGAGLGEISTETGIDRAAATALESDDPNAFATVGPRALAAVLRRLAVILGVEAQSRLRAVVMGHGLTGSPYAVAHRTGRRRGNAKLVQREADRYIAAVRRYLED